MKRLTILLTAAAALFYLGALPMFAQGRHGGGGLHGPSAGSRNNPDTSGGGKSTGGHSNVISGTNLPKPLQSNTKLAQKLEGILGLSSLSALQADAGGFKNFGQFVAAVHVWNNVLKTRGCQTSTPPGCTFAEVKTALFNGGTQQVKSLGSVIHTLDPNADATGESKNARKQADSDIKGS